MPRRYIVTRPAGHAAALSEALRAAGIEPIEVPAVVLTPPASWEPLDDAIRRLSEFDWVLFTSRSGVEAFFGRAGLGFAWPGTLRWAAIGSGTADALHERGISDVWIPSRFLGEAIAREMPAARGDRVLRVRAEQASEVPTEELRARGVGVNDVIGYRTHAAPAASRAQLVRAFAEGVEGVIFTSASTVRGFLDLVDATGLRLEVGSIRLVAIGPVTADALRAEGLTPHAVAAEHSVRGIVEVLAERSDQHAARIRER
ncbi:MAG TPA: uroporphyrinogen-III synthase [bacterium]|nr:uroporphyrinogen-III synthase [bacterium]